MPKVTLEFEVKQTGVDVRQVFGQVDEGMKKLKAGSEGTAKGLERTDASVRELARGAKLFGAVLLADVNPAVAQSVMNFNSLAQASRLAGSAITGGLVVAAAAGVAALVHYTSKTNEAIEFQANLNSMVRRFDISGMKSQLETLGKALEVETDKAKAFLGGLKLPTSIAFEGFSTEIDTGGATIGEALAEGKLKTLRERQKQVREEIDLMAPLFFEQQVINLSTKLRAAQSERALMTGPSASRGAEIIDRLQREERDAKRIIDLQTEVAKGQAATEKERVQITVLGSYQRLIVEEETKTKILAAQRAQAAEELAIRMADLRQSASIRAALDGEDQARQLANAERLHTSLLAMLQGYFAQGLIGEKEFTDQRRQLQGAWVQSNAAALAKATADYKQYTEKIKALDRQMQEAKYATADLLAGIKQAGMTPAEAFADREKRAQEKLAVAIQLSGQEQVDALKKVQQEYAALALEAARTRASQQAAASADPWAAQRRAQQWWLPENQQAKPLGDLDALTQKVKEIGDKITEAFQGMKDGAEESARAARRIVDETERNLRAVQDSVVSVYKLADAYLAAAAAARSIPMPPAPGGGGGGGGGGGDVPEKFYDPGSAGGGSNWITRNIQPGVDYRQVGVGEGGEPIIIVGGEGGFFAGGNGGGGDLPSFQHGGFVPNFLGFPAGSPAGSMASGFAPMRPWGPQNAIGREIPVMASPGEAILNQREQAFMRELVGGARVTDRPAEFTFYLDTYAFMRAMVPRINEAIANGQIKFRAG